MASQVPPEKPPPSQPAKSQQIWDVELLHVNISRKGKGVNAEWAIHPQIKRDLGPDEWNEVSQLMAKVTDIVGRRFSQILTDVEPDPPGNA
jgi:hypothetical protein